MMETMPATYRGTVRKIIFRDVPNEFYIATMRFDEDITKEYKVKGTMPGFREDYKYEVTGTWETSARYGQTFAVTSCREILPESADGIEAYLASGLIKGIGPEYAHRIVEAFGAFTFEILDNQPDRLAAVEGIGPKRARAICKAVSEQKAIRDIMVFLKSIDISNNLASKIYIKYGDQSVSVIRNNPYLLVDDLKGVGFRKADEVAAKLNIPRDSEFRISSAVNYVLRAAADEGDTYLTEENTYLQVVSPEVTDLGDEYLGKVRECVEKMADRHVLVLTDERKIYLPWLYAAERGTAQRTVLIAHADTDLTRRPSCPMTDESCFGTEYSGEQKSAIRLALERSFMILTGGPGTGKTTVTRGIIHALQRAGQKVLLAAPTGRAAKRMSEATGQEAKTIHRLLEYQVGMFQRDEDTPLEGDAVIVDEASMIDVVLMHQLLKAVPEGMKVILVGDTDQLPSVGCGTVLRDIIDSGTVATVRLTKIFRQAQQSNIVMSAYEINRGQVPSLGYNPASDFVFYDLADIAASPKYEEFAGDEGGLMKEFIVRLVKDFVPRRYGIPSDKIQVLAPMRRDWDQIGVIQLNNALQERLNPDGEGLSRGYGKEFRLGDRVMQTKNNYDLDVFNGDIGTVVSVDTGETKLSVSFGDKEVEYTKDRLDELDLAYATTIHKSQGSEYRAVIIPVHRSQYILLQRQLLYTAVTRAKELCIMVGERKALKMGIDRQPVNDRNTDLKELLTRYNTTYDEND